jgi:hypothetical protein
MNAEMFLQLKAKAAKGTPWTESERLALGSSLMVEGDDSVLAGCCVLVSKQSEQYSQSLEVIRKAIERKSQSKFVELSIYEALIYVETKMLAPCRDAVFAFIEESLTRRAINLDNTIFLLGRLARAGEVRAVELLRSLEYDSDMEVRASAGRVLNGLRSE